MPNILTKIAAKRRERVAELKLSCPLAELAERANNHSRSPISLMQSLKQVSSHPRIIAEIKRHSPSAGGIRPALDPSAIALSYQAAGAASISVLTEPDFFHGSDEDLLAVRAAVTVPVLRKDFTVDAYQLYEARLLGADLVLIIAAITDSDSLVAWLELAKTLSLEALVEVHDEADLKKAQMAGASLIGVNNRNLQDFSVSLETSYELISQKQSHELWVSESGLSERRDLLALSEAGYDGFLIGTSLLENADPGLALARLIEG